MVRFRVDLGQPLLVHMWKADLPSVHSQGLKATGKWDDVLAWKLGYPRSTLVPPRSGVGVLLDTLFHHSHASVSSSIKWGEGCQKYLSSWCDQDPNGDRKCVVPSSHLTIRVQEKM